MLHRLALTASICLLLSSNALAVDNMFAGAVKARATITPGSTPNMFALDVEIDKQDIKDVVREVIAEMQAEGSQFPPLATARPELFTSPKLEALSKPVIVEETRASSHSVRSGYPTRGGNWNVLGDNNPSKSKLIQHLYSHSNHSGKFDLGWLNSLSVAELESLHSDDHEGRVHWSHVQRKNQPTSTTQVVRVSTPVQYAKPTARISYAAPRTAACPNGKCPRSYSYSYRNPTISKAKARRMARRR